MPVLERTGLIAALVEAARGERVDTGSLVLVASEASVGKTTLLRARTHLVT